MRRPSKTRVIAGAVMGVTVISIVGFALKDFSGSSELAHVFYMVSGSFWGARCAIKLQ